MKERKQYVLYSPKKCYRLLFIRTVSISHQHIVPYSLYFLRRSPLTTTLTTPHTILLPHPLTPSSYHTPSHHLTTPPHTILLPHPLTPSSHHTPSHHPLTTPPHTILLPHPLTPSSYPLSKPLATPLLPLTPGTDI